MGASFTETFTNGLTKQTYRYNSDSTKSYVIESRLGFAAISKLTVVAGSPNLPVHSRPRKLHLQATTPVNGKLGKRQVPCDLVSIIDDFNALQGGTGSNVQVSLDGQQWTVLGYTGEYYHKSRG
jgi:hypothetical protein